jgi:nicotinamidase-related amidase
MVGYLERGSIMQHTLSDNRLSLDDAVVLFIDHQTGLFQLARNNSPEELRNNVLALADTVRLFRLPAVITTSFEQGPNGPVMPELRERLREAAKYVPRPGQVNAWDDDDFVQAIRDTGRRQLIVAGITTDVCVALPTLSALKAGYQVFVVTDASGSLNKEAHGAALLRMSVAGAQLVSWFSIVGELMQDWRRDPEGLALLLATQMAPYRDPIGSHQAMRR